MSKQIIILFGPPGAGKGTQAELLSDKLNLYHFETSKILEEKFEEAKDLKENSPERFIEVDGKKYDVLEEKKIWLSGVLCSPPFVTHLIKEKVKWLAENNESIIFSGSPRTVYEAEKEIPLFQELYGQNIKAIYIVIKPEETIFRNSHRRICETIRHSILFNKETENLTTCPLDGSKLVKRVGLDDPETIKTRLKEFKERTYPIKDILEKFGIKVVEIDGEQTVSQVFVDICKKIKV
jgi:adenylate kinase